MFIASQRNFPSILSHNKSRHLWSKLIPRPGSFTMAIGYATKGLIWLMASVHFMVAAWQFLLEILLKPTRHLHSKWCFGRCMKVNLWQKTSAWHYGLWLTHLLTGRAAPTCSFWPEIGCFATSGRRLSVNGNSPKSWAAESTTTLRSSTSCPGTTDCFSWPLKLFNWTL